VITSLDRNPRLPAVKGLFARALPQGGPLVGRDGPGAKSASMVLSIVSATGIGRRKRRGCAEVQSHLHAVLPPSRIWASEQVPCHGWKTNESNAMPHRVISS
jgi:hypothetical protein